MELRQRFRVRAYFVLATAAVVLAAVFGVLVKPAPAQAATSVPYLINFQGRLTDNSGNVLSDGSYNVKFRIWDHATSGTNRWEGDRVIGAADNRITVTNGLFNIQFGDTTKGDPALSPALFNSQTFANLYLEVELPTPATAACATNGCAVFTEGAMTPRQPLASSPYAFNSDTLDGIDSASFGQLSAIQSWTDTNTFSKSGGAAVVLSGTAAASGSILQIGSALSGGSASGTLFGANTTSAGDLINLQVSSALRLKVDNSGNLTAAGGITTGGNISFNAGAGRTLGVATNGAGLAGNNLTITAGTSGTGAVNGGDLVLQAGATGGSGTSGSVIVRANGTESATAFQVQNASNAPAFTVDTALNKVVVGDATGLNAATSLLVVDTATADPTTGYNGAMYYNSTSGTFRCYQNSAWTNCITSSITATSNSHASFNSGVQNVAANQTGLATGLLNWTSNIAVGNTTAVAGGFTAPAAGSFRSCLVENNAAITAGTLGLRWRVNGVSVGAAACNMSAAVNRQAATALDTGVVTFPAGATISVALDTSAGFLPTASNDFTIFWSVEYNSSSGNGITLQFVYDSSSTPAGITLANSKDLVVTAADTATDPNLLVNLQCVTSCSTNGRFAVQNAGVDAFAVAPNSGGITLGQSTTVSANRNLTLASGTGTLNQTFANSAASSAQSLAFSNTNAGAGITIQGTNYTPANTNASSGTNVLNLLNFAAGGALGANAQTNGLNFASATGYTNFINTPSFDLNSAGDVTTAFTQLDGATTSNGTGTASTTLILTSAANFDIGNYVQVNSANCGGAGINPCYAKITNKVANTLTITPALTWTNGVTVNEFHVPEIGGVDTAQNLANRYGRGYFIAGVAAGNGTTYYNEDSIDSSLATFNLLTSNVTTLTIGAAGTAVSVPGSFSVAGQSIVNGSGQINGAQLQSGTVANGALTNSAITVTAGNGLTGGGSASLGASTSLAVAYGAAANTAVQGNTSLTCPSGSGNLTGGGTAITLGAGGTCGALTTTNNPSFTTSVTSPSFTGAGAVSISSGGAGALSLSSASGTINIGSNTLQHTTTPFTIDIATAGTSTLSILNSTAAQVANVDVDGSLNVGAGQTYGVGGTPGASATCSGGQMLQNPTLSGGIITAGTCAIPSGSGANTNLSNLLTTSINQTLTANASNSLDIGTTGTTWRTGYFGTSLQSPVFTGTAAVTLSSGGAGALTLDSASNALVIAATDTSLSRTAAGTYTIDLSDAAATTLAVTNSGTGAASLTIDGGVSIGTGQTYKVNGAPISSADLSNDATITKQGNTFNGTSQLVQTNGSGALPALSGANLTSLNPTNLATGSGAVTLQSGGAAALTLTSASGTISLGSATLQRSGAALTVDVANAGASTLSFLNSNGANVVNVSVDGALSIGTGQAYSVGASAGSSATCSGGQMLQNPTLVGGIITAGTCATPSGTGANTNLNNLATTSINQSLIANATNTFDLGASGTTWRTGYFGTSLQSPSFTGAAAVGVSSGGTSDLTLTSASNILNIAATTIRATAAAQTIDVSTAGTATLSILNSNGADVAGLDVEGGLNIGSGQTYKVGSVQISSANLSNDASITKQGNTFNGISQLVQTNGSGALPALSGTNLTNLNAASLTGVLAALNGSALTNLNPTNLATGSGAVTLASGASGALTLDSASATVVLGATTTTLQKSATAFSFDLNSASASTLTVTNAGAGVASLAVEGGVSIGAGQTYKVNNTQISSADLSNDANITKQGNTFNGTSQLVQTTAGGILPVLSGANLTALNASNLATGSGAVSLTSGGATALTLTAGSGTITLGSATLQRAAAALAIDLATAGTSTLTIQNTNGANVTNLDVDGGINIATGQTYKINNTQITSAALSNDATITKQGNTFNGASQLIQTTAGSAYPALNGAAITSLSAANLTGALPAISGASLTNLNPTNLAQGSGAVTLQSAAATALTLTSNAAATWSTTGANQLTLQSGSGTLSLGSTTILTASGALAITAAGTAQNISLNPSTTGTVLVGGTTPTVTATGALTVQSGGTAQNLILNPSTTGKVQIGGTAPSVTTNGATALIVDPGGAAALSLGTTNANAITLGRSGITTTTNGTINVAATAAPTTDQIAITNAGQPVTANGVNGLNITYVGGAIASGGEASGARIDMTPGSTNPSTWNGLRLISTAGAGAGVAYNGLKLEGPGAPGAGTETGLNITTGWDVGVNIQSGGIQFTNMADPATPAANNLRLYSQLVAGRTLLKGIGPSGVDYAYQPSLFQQNVTLITAGSGTAVGPSSFGTQLSATTGTATIPAVAEATGFLENFATANTTGQGAGFMTNTNQYYRGSTANGSNGFFTMARVEFPDAAATYTAANGARFWAGMTTQATQTGMTASDAPTGDFAGFRLSGSATETTFRFLTRNNATTTNVNTGVTLTQGKTYDLYTYVAPLGTTIFWRIDNLTDGTAPVEGSQTLTLPTAATAMRYTLGIGTLANTTRNLRFQRIYIESDR